MMNTNTTTLAPTPHEAPIPVCGCGQDLDNCCGQHCPRCGRTRHDVPFVLAA